MNTEFREKVWKPGSVGKTTKLNSSILFSLTRMIAPFDLLLLTRSQDNFK